MNRMVLTRPSADILTVRLLIEYNTIDSHDALQDLSPSRFSILIRPVKSWIALIILMK